MNGFQRVLLVLTGVFLFAVAYIQSPLGLGEAGGLPSLVVFLIGVGCILLAAQGRQTA